MWKVCKLWMDLRLLRRKGIIAITLDEDDDLIDAKLTDGNQEILLSAANGMACRFRETDIRPMGRQAAGVKGMNLKDSSGKQISTIVAMAVLKADDELLVVTANGFGKRTPIGASDPADVAALPAPTDSSDSPDGTEQPEQEEVAEPAEAVDSGLLVLGDEYSIMTVREASVGAVRPKFPSDTASLMNASQYASVRLTFRKPLTVLNRATTGQWASR